MGRVIKTFTAAVKSSVCYTTAFPTKHPSRSSPAGILPWPERKPHAGLAANRSFELKPGSHRLKTKPREHFMTLGSY
jgi:hypothetical protein